MSQPKFVLGSGEIVTPGSAKDAQMLREAGLREAGGEDIRVDALKKQYSDWQYGVAAAGIGALNTALPGATGLVAGGVGMVDQEAGHRLADAVEGIEAAHPYAHTAGMVAGALVPGGAAMKGMSLAKTAAVGALQGAAMTADDLALEHLRTPEGSEKTLAAMGLGALFGGAANAATFGLAKWARGGTTVTAGGQWTQEAGGIGRMGERMEAKGTAGVAATSPVGNPGVVAKLQEMGVVEPVEALAEKYDLYRASPRAVRAKLGDVIKTAEATMNEAKAISSEALPAQAQVKFVTDIKAQLAGTDLAETVAKKVSVAEGQTVAELHQLRIKLDKNVNWKDPSSAASQKFIAARDMVNDHIKSVLEHNAEINPDLAGDQVERWLMANSEYRGAKALQDALRYSEASGKSFLSQVGGMAATMGKWGAAGSLMSGNLAGVAGGGALWAGGTAVQAASDAALGSQALRGLGKFVQAFDDKVVQTVASGLAEKGMSGKLLGAPLTEMTGLNDYVTTAAGIKWISENPAQAVPEMAQRMEDAGVPGEVIDSAVPQTIKAAQYLGSVAPKDPWLGTTVAPTAWQPTLRQKAEFIDRVNAVNNPLWALQNPSPVRMEAVRAVYPILAQRAALMVAQEAATQASMTLAARKWAASVTGQSATPLSNPQARAAMALIDAQEQQQAAGQAQGQQGAGSNIVSLTQTRLGRMSE